MKLPDSTPRGASGEWLTPALELDVHIRRLSYPLVAFVRSASETQIESDIANRRVALGAALVCLR
jgi:hypothetical protein